VVVISCFLFILRARSENFTRQEQRLDLALSLSQLGMPLLFTVLAAPPVRLQNGDLTSFPFKPTMYILIGALALAGYFDIGRRLRLLWRGEAAPGMGVSPWALVALLVYLESVPIVWPAISTDDFHAGEFYLPWWLLREFGQLPFVDYEPARGLTNYVPGMLASLFAGNTFSSQSLVVNLYSAIYVFVAFFVSRGIIGDLPAFLSVFALSTMGGLPLGSTVVSIAALAVIAQRPTGGGFVRTFWLWVGLTALVVLFSLAEGAVVAVAGVPLGLWFLAQAYRNERSRLLLSAALIIPLVIVLGLATRAGAVVIGAAQYLLGQAAVNDVAHGLAWQYPLSDIDSMVTAGYFWQVVRFSWLLLIVPVVYLLLRSKNSSLWSRDGLFLLAFLIASMLTIPRAAGRVDPSVFSRPGFATIGFIVYGLPLVVLPFVGNPARRAEVVLALSLAFGLLGSQESKLEVAWGFNSTIASEPVDLVSGDTYGLRNIGEDVSMDRDQLGRQVGIRRVLNRILKQGETYYDATNHSADYGYQGRPSPVSITAFYNAPATAQQLEVIAELEAKQIPLALVGAENIIYEGGTLPLRAFWIYKYLLRDYAPFADGAGRVWMIRKDRMRRLDGSGYVVAASGEAAALLDQAFGGRDLGGQPGAWGASSQSLLRGLAPPVDLLSTSAISTNDMQRVGVDTWRVTGSDPFLVIAAPGAARGDILQIQLAQPIPIGVWKLNWTNDLVPAFDEKSTFTFSAGTQEYLVPVSAAPDW
ncbi:MAG TPA: hypothetical protein VFH29_00430, partial [Anaerolineales bacterium]|nr:hypothetical protein [Anaerolineales bacterium]